MKIFFRTQALKKLSILDGAIGTNSFNHAVIMVHFCLIPLERRTYNFYCISQVLFLFIFNNPVLYAYKRSSDY